MQDLMWLDVLEKTFSVAVSVITIDKLLSVSSNSSVYTASCSGSTAISTASCTSST